MLRDGQLYQNQRGGLHIGGTWCPLKEPQREQE